MTKRFWICKFLLALAFVLGGPMLHAQLSLTSAAGTLVDQDGTTWFNAQVTATFVPNPSYPNLNQYYVTDPVNGTVPLTGPVYNQYITQHATSSSVGTFAIALIDNSKIAPTGSSWKLTIQSYTSAPSAVFPNVTVSGISQVLNSFLSANITAPRFSAVSGFYGGAFGYNNAEISVIPVPGGSYYDVTLQTVKVWNGTAWTQQAIGSYCPLTGSCNYTGAVTARQFNNVCEASQEPGADFVAQINACANESYMTLGGIITAYGYGNTSQVATTIWTATTVPNRPIAVLMGPATRFFFNENFGSAVAAATASELAGHGSATTGTGGPCIIPIASNSALTRPSVSSFGSGGYMALGPIANTYDFLCNANQDGTEENMKLENLSLLGNSAATFKGSMIHLKNIYTPTDISQVTTDLAYGNVVQIDNGDDISFYNDTFSDGATTGGYLGSILTLNCALDVNFYSGAIQDQGVNNALMVLNSNASEGGNCNPQGGGGYQPTGVHFYGVDFEILAATVGAFSGHATNVDPIQIADPEDVTFDHLILYGAKGAGQIHVVDVTGANGNIKGPLEINNMVVLAGTGQWSTGTSLIHNTIAGTPATLADVFGQPNSGSTIGIGKYRWLGGVVPGDYLTDYEDNKNIANLISNTFSIVPTVYATVNGFCVAGYEGHVLPITDSAVKQPGQLIVGGGSFHVMAYCNGTAWSVMGSVNTAGFTQSATVCASGCSSTQTICSTTGSAWQNGACNMTIPWPANFPDNNYSVVCNAYGVVSGPQTVFFPESKAVNQISGYLESTQASVGTTQEIDCTGVHN
jgi:hypothetical protein